MLPTAARGWSDKHYQALFVIIRDKELPITTNVLYRIFSPHGDVEKIIGFQTMSDFHAQANFYSYGDANHAFANFKVVRFMKAILS